MNDLREGPRFESNEENVAYARGLLDAQTFANRAGIACMGASFFVGFILGVWL